MFIYIIYSFIYCMSFHIIIINYNETVYFINDMYADFLKKDKKVKLKKFVIVL